MNLARMLVVDDDAASCQVLAHILRYNDIEVDVATNAHDAMYYLAHNAYSLAILDLAMPDVDGWELLYAIHTNPATASLPCVAVTAYYDPAVAVEAENAGFVRCFPKPVLPTFANDLSEIFS